MMDKLSNEKPRFFGQLRFEAIKEKFRELRKEFRKQLQQELFRRDSRTPTAIQADVLDDFATTIDFAMRASMAAAGVPTSNAGEWSSIVFTKMCINAASAETLARSAIFDHTAIVIICRTIMESMTVFFYLQEKVNSSQWHCRELILRLHDTTSRIKLMRGWQTKDQYEDLIRGQATVRADLQANFFFQSLLPEQQKKLLTGEQFFVGGMNAAAVRAGWKQEQFLALYNYFSAQSHAAPMSFMRFKRHNMDFSEPSDAQKSLVSMALCVASMCLLRTSMRHLSLTPEAETKFGKLELVKFRRKNRESDRLLKGE